MRNVVARSTQGTRHGDSFWVILPFILWPETMVNSQVKCRAAERAPFFFVCHSTRPPLKHCSHHYAAIREVKRNQVRILIYVFL